MRCAFGARLDVGLAERSTPCRFIGTNTFSSLISGKMTVFDKTESLSGVCFIECHDVSTEIRSPNTPASCRSSVIQNCAFFGPRSAFWSSLFVEKPYNSISCISRKLHCMSDKNYSCVAARFSSRATISSLCAASVAPRYSFNPMSMISYMSMVMTVIIFCATSGTSLCCFSGHSFNDPTPMISRLGSC